MPSRWRVFTAASGVVYLVVALGLGFFVAHGGPNALDGSTESLSRDAVDIGWLEWLLLKVEFLGEFWPVLLITAAVTAYLIYRRAMVSATLLVTTMLLQYLSVRVLKEAFERDRPEWQSATDVLSSFAYPSGHAAAAATFAIVIGLIVTARMENGWPLRQAWAALTAGVVVVGLDRILLGRHYLLDVLGGVLIGVAIALLVSLLLPPERVRRTPPPLPEVFPSQRRLAVVLNPIKVPSVDAFKSAVAQEAIQSGWSEPSWHLTTIEDPGTGMAHDAALAGSDLVLVCGGDGTVREVCAELAGTGIPVGIIPAGTGNLLARNLDIPLDLRTAVDSALNGQDRAIDLVEVSGDGVADTHFMVMAGMGFDAAIMEGVNEDVKKKIGWLAYVISGLKALMFPEMKIEISVDGGEFTTHRARTVVVGNVGFLQAGMPLLPDAEIDDGQLDVVLLHPRRFLSWLPIVTRIITRAQRTDDKLNRMTGREFTLRASEPVPRQLDGDPVGEGETLTMRCLPGKLLVRVPR